jgi:hypothetical protein
MAKKKRRLSAAAVRQTAKRVISMPGPKRTKTTYPLVQIVWEDSTQPTSDWQWIEDYQMPQIIRCASVGYLIADTKQALAIAANLGDLDKERAQASGIIRIPRRAVLSITKLKPI